MERRGEEREVDAGRAGGREDVGEGEKREERERCR